VEPVSWKLCIDSNTTRDITFKPNTDFTQPFKNILGIYVASLPGMDHYDYQEESVSCNDDSPNGPGWLVNGNCHDLGMHNTFTGLALAA
jgi:hypothetical protein